MYQLKTSDFQSVVKSDAIAVFAYNGLFFLVSVCFRAISPIPRSFLCFL